MMAFGWRWFSKIGLSVVADYVPTLITPKFRLGAIVDAFYTLAVLPIKGVAASSKASQKEAVQQPLYQSNRLCAYIRRSRDHHSLLQIPAV